MVAIRHICLAVIVWLITAGLSGCADTESARLAQPAPPQILRAVGYGTVRPDKGLTVNQMKLMAMRASRMDAYRNLVEQVHGIHIAGNTTIGTMIADNDSYQGYVNGYLHGATLISQEPLGDNYTYQTTLELTLNDDFYTFAKRQLAAYPPPAPPSAKTATNGLRHYYNSH